MRKSVQWLSALVVVQLLLVALLWWRGDGGDEAMQAGLFSIGADTLQSLRIESSESAVTLQREAGNWLLADSGLPADQGKVDALVQSLLMAQGGWPVATTADAAERFQVTDEAPAKRVSVSAAARTETLLVGNSAGFKQVYARLPETNAVYQVGLDSFSLSAQPADWLDKTLLRPQGELQGLQGADYQLVPGPADAEQGEPQWQLADATEMDVLDQDKVQRLVNAVRNLRITGVAQTPIAGEPTGTLQLMLADAERQWRLYRQDDQWQIEADARPQRFELVAGTAEVLAWRRADLLKAPAPAE